MFTDVHHVEYVVNSVKEMADYMDTNFGLKPDRTSELPERGDKSIVYQVGSSILYFFEPTKDGTAMARQLKEMGPSVLHVAWAVDGIDQAFQHLKSKGAQVRGDSPRPSPFGYQTVTIEPESSHGILFQLAEGEMS